MALYQEELGRVREPAIFIYYVSKCFESGTVDGADVVEIEWLVDKGRYIP